MLAIRISANGGPEVLTPTDIPTPSPGPGEVLIRHGACGLNYIDIYQRSGLLVSFGNASGPVPAIAPLRLSQGGSLFLTRPTLFDYIPDTHALDEAAQALFGVIADGAVKVLVAQRYSLADASTAHIALSARETVGASVLIP